MSPAAELVRPALMPPGLPAEWPYPNMALLVTSGVLPALCWDIRDTVPSSCAGLALQGCSVSWLNVSGTSQAGEAAVTLPSKLGFLQI